ncbi:platelet-activating factor acetylhydrolase [Coniochaeta sp. PMI_546]|nr:platelet-activating factor acetylhydrolase [Coniochaeta sp. PMI_546]
MATANLASQKLSSYLSRLNPIPGFPEYTGPYKVGTIDVEIPISELEPASPTPEDATHVHTVLFRVFYPATPDTNGKRITWLPAPQRLHVSAYTQFLGIGPMVASVLSFLPRHMNYISIPVHKNASLESPPSDIPSGRWPTMVFDHGLGGSRNAYSHFAGSLASHGVVVICPEHRDGSAVLSLIRDPKNQDRYFRRNTQQAVPYVRIGHTQTPEVWRARDKQIRIRCWELGLFMEALVGLDTGISHIIESNMNGTTPVSALQQFKGKLDIHEPGKIIFGGHSFGAATMVQLLKSTYYADRKEIASMADPAFTPRPDSAIRKQITERNPIILLDMWCFPLVSASFAPLLDLPLPAYADVPTAPGGTAILAVESETFFKWTEHLHAKARILSPNPTARVVSAADFERPSGVRLPEPNVFYVKNSAHLNQSDFGVLFPWLCKKVFGADAPERALRLNLRAALQFLRGNNVPVARTWAGDLVEGAHVDKLDASNKVSSGASKDFDDGIHEDRAILNRKVNGAVEAWSWIDIIGLGGEAAKSELELAAVGEEGHDFLPESKDAERQMEGEMEPGATAPGALEAETVGAVEQPVAASA